MGYLILKDILLNYYGQTALEIKNFTAENSFAVIGCSGCGKSNFLKVIAGLEQIERGEIFVGGNEIGNKKPSQREMSLISSRTPLDPSKSAYENLVYPLKKRHYSKPEIAAALKRVAYLLVEDTDTCLKCNKAQNIIESSNCKSYIKCANSDCIYQDKKDIIAGKIPDLAVQADISLEQIKSALSKEIRMLSPRKQTELIFARALIKNPSILLLDEPEKIIQDMPRFVQLLRQTEKFFVWATYDFLLTAQVVNRFVIMRAGDIIFDGSLEDIKQSDNKYIQMMCFPCSETDIKN